MNGAEIASQFSQLTGSALACVVEGEDCAADGDEVPDSKAK